MMDFNEPWIWNGYYVNDKNGILIADIGDNDEYGSRIVACVNKCAGIPQELLEQPEYSIKAELDNVDEQINLRCEAEEYIEELNEYIKQLEEQLAELQGVNG